MEWHQRNKGQNHTHYTLRSLEFTGLTKLMVGVVNFGYKTEVVMKIGIAELLAFAYNLKCLLRLTKLKYTHIFIVDFQR